MTTFYAAADGAGRVHPLKRRLPGLYLAYDYAGALAAGTVLEADRAVATCPDLVLRASTDVEHAVAGTRWPVRVFEVTGEPVDQLSRGRSFHAVTVHRELRIEEVFGPGGAQVAALLDDVVALKDDPVQLTETIEALGAAWRQVNPGADPRREPPGPRLEDAPVQAQSASVVTWLTLLGAVLTCTDSDDRAAAIRAVKDAVRALACRHLLDEGTSWNRAAYEKLTTPAREVFAALRPQDVPVGR